MTDLPSTAPFLMLNFYLIIFSAKNIINYCVVWILCSTISTQYLLETLRIIKHLNVASVAID